MDGASQKTLGTAPADDGDDDVVATVSTLHITHSMTRNMHIKHYIIRNLCKVSL